MTRAERVLKAAEIMQKMDAMIDPTSDEVLTLEEVKQRTELESELHQLSLSTDEWWEAKMINEGEHVDIRPSVTSNVFCFLLWLVSFLTGFVFGQLWKSKPSTPKASN